MNRSLLYLVLEGDKEAIALFGEAENCAVIDWRDGPTEIVAAIADFLPDGYLTVERVKLHSCELVVQGKPPTAVALAPKAMQENLLFSINQAIEPAYELRQFRRRDGDSYSIFVAPRPIWSEIDRTHSRATESLFLSARRLAVHWSKSYLARLFSNP